MNARAPELQPDKPRYRTTSHSTISHLGSMTADDQRAASRGAAIAQQYDPTLSPEARVKRALEGQNIDIDTLKMTLGENPQLLEGNIVLQKLIRDKLSEKQRKDVADSIVAPDPFNKHMPVSPERQALAAKLMQDGQGPDGASTKPREIAPREVARPSPF